MPPFFDPDAFLLLDKKKGHVRQLDGGYPQPPQVFFSLRAFHLVRTLEIRAPSRDYDPSRPWKLPYKMIFACGP